jgi:hypothetical protein
VRIALCQSSDDLFNGRPLGPADATLLEHGEMFAFRSPSGQDQESSVTRLLGSTRFDTPPLVQTEWCASNQ